MPYRALKNIGRRPERDDASLIATSSDLHLETICRATALFFEVPIVLVTLVDETHVHIRAGCGVDAGLVPRADAFCDRTVRGRPGEALVIADIQDDEVYARSPLVLGGPKARFYAGMPLSSESGINVGTLCLMDTLPRFDFHTGQVSRLRDFAQVVEAHFRLHGASLGRQAEERDRRRMEALLAISETEMQAVRSAQSVAESAASFGQWSLVAVDAPVLWSEGIARIFGRPRPADGMVDIEDHLRSYHPDDRAVVRSRIVDAFAGIDLPEHGGYQVRARIVRPDGETRNVLVDGHASRDRHGRVTSLSGILLDVTDLARSEHQALETSELLRYTLENMDQGLLMLGPDGRVRIHNRRVRDLLGLPAELLYEGAPFEDIRRFLVDRGEYRDADEKTRAWSVTGVIETEPTSYERRRPDGTALEIRAVPLSDGGVVRTFADVSQRKAVERSVQESERRYRILAENTTDVIVWADLDTVRRYVSPAASTILGYDPEELVGSTALALTHPDDAERYGRTLRDLCAGTIEQAVSAQRYRRRDGVWIWIEASLSLTRDDAGIATGFVGSLRDISVRKGIEDALRDSEERLALALDGGCDGIWDLDVVLGNVTLSRGWVSMLGYGEDDIDPGLPAWRALTHSDDLRRLKGALVRHLRGETASFECEYRVRNKAGQYFWSLARGKVVARDERGRALRMVGTHMNVTQRKEAELLVEHMALHDALTGLPNRVLFNDYLERTVAEAARRSSRFAVLACDLDRFKAVNDMLGHAAGDLMLKAIATRLRSIVRAGDMIARLGGDEFAIILRHVDQPEEAVRLARCVIEGIEAPIEVDGRAMSVGVSIGIAISGGDEDADRVLKNADTALFGAKADGRHACRVFEPGMDARVADRNLLEHDLKEAVRSGDLLLNYQPVIDLMSGEVHGFEALMRWVHPMRGAVSPADFIPIAEETGLIVQMGAWALREACREAATWPSNVRIAVNVSTMQFRQDGLERIVAAALTDTGLAPNRLELEITESVLVHDAEGVIGCLHRLRALGVRIALDDFGTGYSSLSYLRRFPFDKIKIDRSFIQEIDDPGTAAIVGAVVGLGKRVGARITAEGIETESQLSSVVAVGCTEAQGFLFARAGSAEDARAFLRPDKVRRA